jgi:hypothetical protein
VCEHGDTSGIKIEIIANRPDVIKNKADKICVFIDIEISWDRNVIKKEAEKKLKYRNRSIEIQGIWYKNCFVIPVITGAT